MEFKPINHAGSKRASKHQAYNSDLSYIVTRASKPPEKDEIIEFAWCQMLHDHGVIGPG